jgi:hypothetical protein
MAVASRVHDPGGRFKMTARKPIAEENFER